MKEQSADRMAIRPALEDLLSPKGNKGVTAMFGRALDSQKRRRFDDALACYRNIMMETAEACYNMGAIYYEQRQWPNSVVHFKKALDLNPGFTDAAYNLAMSLKAAGQFKKAILIYQLALDLEPDLAEAYFNQGLCHLNLAAPEPAVKTMCRAVALAPAKALYWFHLAEANLFAGDMEAVYSCYRKAIALKPQWVSAHYNLAVALRLGERFGEAIDHLKHAIHIDPGYKKALPLLYRLAQHACDWPLIDHVSHLLDQVVQEELRQGLKTTEPPMTSIRRHADVRSNMAIASSWSGHLSLQTAEANPQPLFRHPMIQDAGRIRVGYLSSDFKDHAVAHQIRGLFENHDRRRFEIFGYACNPDNGTPYRKKLADACDHFRDVHRDANLSIAQQIHADGIHILVDMSGHSRDNRLGVAALRPAPIQVSYLGFLSTTGATFIDYVIADTLVVPEEHATLYTEKIAYLPHCYQANDDQMPIARQVNDRSHWNLPDQAFVFCSFNQPYKIDAVLFKTWMRILHDVDDSVLWLVKRSPVAQRNLKQAAERAGIDPDRLVFTGFVPLDQNLARLQLADLVLDTLIYNGGATTANALWAGVPVLTTLGRHWVSRMSASALKAMDFPELITQDLRTYGRKAIELARDPRQLSDIRQRLWQRRSNAPLFDTPRFTRNMEKAFAQMWRRHTDGMQPVSFKVQP